MYMQYVYNILIHFILNLINIHVSLFARSPTHIHLLGVAFFSVYLTLLRKTSENLQFFSSLYTLELFLSLSL